MGRDMKKQFKFIVIPILLIFSFVSSALAQEINSDNKYWFQTGLGGSTEGISFAIGGSFITGKFIGTAKIESSSQLLFPESSAVAASLLGGVSFQRPSSNSDRILFVNLQAGLGSFTFERCVENCGILSSSKPRNSRETSISLPVNAQLLAGFSKNLGLGFEFGTTFNSIKIYPSFHFTVIVGKLHL